MPIGHRVPQSWRGSAGFLAAPLLWMIERMTGESVDYLHQVAKHSTSAFWKFVFFMPMSGHRTRGGATKEACHAARLAATRVEDCGPCVQTVLRMARDEGVDGPLLRAVFDGRLDDLPGGADGELALACRYADAVARAAPEAGELADEVARRLGDKAQVDLALAVAAARVYPTLKRGLGHARSCQLIDVDAVLGDV